MSGSIALLIIYCMIKENCVYCCWKLRRVLTTYVKPSNFVTPDNADERKGTSLPFTEGRRCATWDLGSSGVRMTLGPPRARMLACRVEW